MSDVRNEIDVEWKLGIPGQIRKRVADAHLEVNNVRPAAQLMAGIEVVACKTLGTLNSHGQTESLFEASICTSSRSAGIHKKLDPAVSGYCSIGATIVSQ